MTVWDNFFTFHYFWLSTFCATFFESPPPHAAKSAAEPAPDPSQRS